MVNGLAAPDAAYFTSPDDGICWLKVTNEGACAMEFDTADELFTFRSQDSRTSDA